jgi:hypothetical protein
LKVADLEALECSNLNANSGGGESLSSSRLASEETIFASPKLEIFRGFSWTRNQTWTNVAQPWQPYRVCMKILRKSQPVGGVKNFIIVESFSSLHCFALAFSFEP